MDTYVVRIWRPSEAEPGSSGIGDPHGTIRHVGSGREASFQGTSELIELLGRSAVPTPAGTVHDLDPNSGRERVSVTG